MAVQVTPADRVKTLPPYLFAEIDRLKSETKQKGVDVIDLGVGDPDLATPEFIRQTMKVALDDKAHHRYPSYTGMTTFLEAVAEWYQRRFNVKLHPTQECVTLIGSKEGIAHIPLALVNPGDVVLCPNPGYPVYAIGTQFAGGEVYAMPLLEKNNYLPDLKAIPETILKRAKLMHINYPNNPTGALATRKFYEDVVAFANQHNIIVCSDAAYTELYFDGHKPLSFLEVPGAKEVGIEFHSLSKSFNMTGWRLGMAVGHRDVIAALGKIKTNVDSGQFQAVQMAGITALREGDQFLSDLRKIYEERKNAFTPLLEKAGLKFKPLQASFYLWVSVPAGETSASFAKRVLTEAGIVCTPGTGFGEYGEGYVRFTLCNEVERLQAAGNRLIELMKK